jgi:hypothetical protein
VPPGLDLPEDHAVGEASKSLIVPAWSVSTPYGQPLRGVFGDLSLGGFSGNV